MNGENLSNDHVGGESDRENVQEHGVEGRDGHAIGAGYKRDMRTPRWMSDRTKVLGFVRSFVVSQTASQGWWIDLAGPSEPRCCRKQGKGGASPTCAIVRHARKNETGSGYHAQYRGSDMDGFRGVSE